MHWALQGHSAKAVAQRLGVACALVAVAAVSGCGSGGHDTAPVPVFAPGSPTPGFPGHSPAAQLPGPAGMPGPSQPPPGQPAPPDAPNTVAIANFAYAPTTITVKVGSTVTWTNRDEEPHNVVSGDHSVRSPTMGTGATFSYTFTKPGSVGYVCTLHPYMHGTVVVTP